MKRFLWVIVMVFACGGAAMIAPAAAQDIVRPVVPPAGAGGLSGAAGEVSKTAQCFKVINKAPYTVLGTFVTDVYTDDKGQQGRHRSNFRLDSDHASEFCTYGPYYEGGKLELVIRTLVPVFSCKTRVDADIVIHGRRKPEGGTDTWAVCR